MISTGEKTVIVQFDPLFRLALSDSGYPVGTVLPEFPEGVKSILDLEDYPARVVVKDIFNTEVVLKGTFKECLKVAEELAKQLALGDTKCVNKSQERELNSTPNVQLSR